MCYLDPCPCEAADPKRGYYPMNKSKQMVDTTDRAKKMTPTGRKPSNPNLQTLPTAKQRKQMCSVDTSKVEVRMTAANAQVESCEPSDNVELFDSPESSNISGALYYKQECELRIIFKSHKPGSADRMYKYPNFPGDLWIAFKLADSKGSFFATRIKGSYTGTAL